MDSLLKSWGQFKQIFNIPKQILGWFWQLNTWFDEFFAWIEDEIFSWGTSTTRDSIEQNTTPVTQTVVVEQAW